MAALSPQDNNAPVAVAALNSAHSIIDVKRITKESDVCVKINLDGSGIASCNTGIPFLDHMLDQLASHGLFDLSVRATGDIHIDDPRTNEGVAIAIGKVLGDRKGIYGRGHFAAPLDEAATEVKLDLFGHHQLSYDLLVPTKRVGTYDTQLVEKFFQSLVNTSGITLSIRQLAGKNSHHIIEATFKAFAKALRQAIEYDVCSGGSVPSSLMVAFSSQGNKALAAAPNSSCRVGEVKRTTKETDVCVKINLDGSGVANCCTGIPFLDHTLDKLASHGLFDLNVKAIGDIHIDDHHTNEDVALAIGTALLQALGERKGIFRFGHFAAPPDEPVVQVILDLSGRPHLSYNLIIPIERVGTYDTQLVEHFFQSLVNTSGMTLHILQLAEKDPVHIIEATIKAFARALRQAINYDVHRGGSIPSSKGILSRS
ncbi:imidazoleglycerol-phosphate dehydratase [Canna indica]|uniref:Imidazoleglycerol-phosphate dehydratase n=1 Tax=Canna indica TaxID=4628 RepID=A0AAQ3QIA0_9LILI|nr:imidazoleglycerol-phosphate dehydratase [Canna indica]